MTKNINVLVTSEVNGGGSLGQRVHDPHVLVHLNLNTRL